MNGDPQNKVLADIKQTVYSCRCTPAYSQQNV